MSFITIRGKVKNGKKIGSRIGFPTINISIPRGITKDRWGIYFTLVRIDHHMYPGVTHLGPVKTFSLRRRTCETFLLTLRRDLYGATVEKKLLFKFRDIEKFPTTKALKKQIANDIKAAKKFFGL
jgi:riboflavin kinase/FMN adenylyltransferase